MIDTFWVVEVQDASYGLFVDYGTKCQLENAIDNEIKLITVDDIYENEHCIRVARIVEMHQSSPAIRAKYAAHNVMIEEEKRARGDFSE
jgi:hypothetical protein